MTRDEINTMAKNNAFIKVPEFEGENGAPGPFAQMRSWPIVQKFYTELRGKPIHKNDEVGRAATKVFLSNAFELFKIKCNTCNGFGHSAKFCTTWPRLKTAGGVNKHVQGWLKKAKDRCYKDIKPDGIGDPDILGCLANLPYDLPEGFVEKAKKGSKRKGKTLMKHEFV